MSNPTTAAMRLDVLDFLRGIAAQLVVINHMRATYFADFAEISARDPITIAFYTLTGFGHQAVIIFFVVSGFLVGGAAGGPMRPKPGIRFHFSCAVSHGCGLF